MECYNNQNQSNAIKLEFNLERCIKCNVFLAQKFCNFLLGTFVGVIVLILMLGFTHISRQHEKRKKIKNIFAVM